MNDPLRIVATNLADSCTVTAGNNASAELAATNLLFPGKQDIWRSLGRMGALTLAFANPVTFDAIGLGFTNLSSAATMRVRASNEATATNLLTANSDRFESWGSAPGSTRYVQAPDGTMNAVVPKPDAAADRWQIDIPANTYTNGTVLLVSWHQKTVPHSGTGGQGINPTAWVGATAGAVGTVASVNGWSRKYMTVTITDASLTQNLRFYTPVVNADDVAAWGWMLTLGNTLTSYYPTLATFTSRAAGTSTYINAAGVVTDAASGTARMQYQYPSLAAVAPRLLVEPQSANLLTYSEPTLAQLSFYTTVTQAATALQGFATAIQFVQSASATPRAYWAYTSNIGTAYTLSFFIKMDDGGLPIWGQGLAGSDFTVVVESLINANVPVITPLADGIYRVSVAFTATVGGSVRFGVAKYFAQSARGFRVSGCQLELNSLTSYIRTTAAAVTRFADVAAYSNGVRPAGYMDWWQSYDYDSGDVVACPGGGAEVWAWGKTAIGVNGLPYGGGANACLWLAAPVTARNVVITLTDTGNASSYLEAARVVAGKYWTPSVYGDYGAPIEPVDKSIGYRTEAGNLVSDPGTRHRKQTVNLTSMSAADREALWKILWRNGTTEEVWFSLYPQNTDTTLEQQHLMLAKMTVLGGMSTPTYRRWSNTLTLEEV